jgi:ABC-type branched-subunit amino acid transport system ATPase component
VDLRDVSVVFGGVAAVADVTVEIPTCAVAAIIGPNGAGKSTLLNAISGLARPTSGSRISVLGRRIDDAAPSERPKRGIGRSFQNPAMLEDETVLENVLCGAHSVLRYSMLDQIVRRRHVRAREELARAQAQRLLAVVDLWNVRDQPVSSLPYGARKLLDIARAAMASPAVLLLDEPTSGLDAHEQDVVKQILLDIRSLDRVTVLVVEHHMDIVRDVATLILGLEAGRLVASGTADEVLESSAFRAAVLGAEDVELALVPPAGSGASR